MKTQVIYALVAFFAGLVVVMGNGLPVMGFAMADSFYVLAVIIGYAMFTSSQIRRTIFKRQAKGMSTI